MNIKGVIKAINQMGKALTSGEMEITMRDNGMMVSDKVLANGLVILENSTMVSGVRGRHQDLVS